MLVIPSLAEATEKVVLMYVMLSVAKHLGLKAA